MNGAAADLLQACREVFRTAEGQLNSDGSSFGYLITDEALCWVKDAIAKATGEPTEQPEGRV